MLKFLFVIPICIFLVEHAGADERWMLIAETSDSQFYIKKGTLAGEETRGGEGVVSIIGKQVIDDLIEIEKWYVTAEDCLNEYGKLVTLDTDGEFKYDTEFAFGGNTPASSIAEIICTAAIQAVTETEEKGI